MLEKSNKDLKYLNDIRKAIFPWLPKQGTGFTFNPFHNKGKSKVSEFLYQDITAFLDIKKNANIHSTIADMLLSGFRASFANTYYLWRQISKDEYKSFIDEIDIKQEQPNWVLSFLKWAPKLNTLDRKKLPKQSDKYLPFVAFEFYQIIVVILHGYSNSLLTLKETVNWVELTLKLLTEYFEDFDIFFDKLQQDSYMVFDDDEYQEFLSLAKCDMALAREQWQKIKQSPMVMKEPIWYALRNVIYPNKDDTNLAAQEIANPISKSIFYPEQNNKNSFYNILGVFAERPFWGNTSRKFTAKDVFFNGYNAMAGADNFRLWLVKLFNAHSLADLENLEKYIGLLDGQTKQLQTRINYWLDNIGDDAQQFFDWYEKLNDYSFNMDPAYVAFADDKVMELVLADENVKDIVSSYDFSIFDDLEMALIYRNTYLAELFDEDEMFKKVNPIMKKLTKKINNWHEFTELAACCSLLNNSFPYNYKAKAEILTFSKNILSPMLWLDWQQMKQGFADATQPYEATRFKAVLSLDYKKFIPSAKKWALNVSNFAFLPRLDLISQRQATLAMRSENTHILIDSWNIHKKEDLIEALEWFQTTGNRYNYTMMLDELSQRSDKSIEEEVNDIINMTGSEPIGELGYKVRQLRMYLDNIGSIRSCSFWAWDLSAYSSIVQRAYMAMLIDEKQAWQYLISAALKLQQEYNGWEEAYWDNFSAHLFMRAPQEKDKQTDQQLEYIRNLTNPICLLSYPWRHLPWDMDLTNEIDAEDIIEFDPPSFTSEHIIEEETPPTIH